MSLEIEFRVWSSESADHPFSRNGNMLVFQDFDADDKGRMTQILELVERYCSMKGWPTRSIHSMMKRYFEGCKESVECYGPQCFQIVIFYDPTDSEFQYRLFDWTEIKY